MDNHIIEALTAIMDTYGDAVFYNYTKTKNLLHDIVPSMHKERIQVGNFLEMNGYFQLKYAGKAYFLVRSRLIRAYVSTYAVNEATATWVVDVFSSLLGYNNIMVSAEFSRNRPVSIPVAMAEHKTREHNKTNHSASAQTSSSPSPPECDRMYGEPAKRAVNNAVPADSTVKTAVEYASRISADFHSVAVTQDGRVLAAGLNNDGQCNTFAWRNITAVSAGTYFTVGLRKDGTAVAVGRNDYGQCNVRSWTDIVAVSAGTRHTVGLKADGSVVATGQNKNGELGIDNWRNIIHVSAGYFSTFGIKKDRRALVKGDNKEGDLTASHLRNVRDIANAGPGRAIALMDNGTVARLGRKDYMNKDFSRWADVRQISAAPDYFAGLLGNGRVRLLAYFWEDTGVECGAEDWRDIVAVAAGRYHLLGLRKDGTLAAVMMHPDRTRNRGQCRVEDWRI